MRADTHFLRGAPPSSPFPTSAASLPARRDGPQQEDRGAGLGVVANQRTVVERADDLQHLLPHPRLRGYRVWRHGDVRTDRQVRRRQRLRGHHYLWVAHGDRECAGAGGDAEPVDHEVLTVLRDHPHLCDAGVGRPRDRRTTRGRAGGAPRHVLEHHGQGDDSGGREALQMLRVQDHQRPAVQPVPERRAVRYVLSHTRCFSPERGSTSCPLDTFHANRFTHGHILRPPPTFTLATHAPTLSTRITPGLRSNRKQSIPTPSSVSRNKMALRDARPPKRAWWYSASIYLETHQI